MLGDFWELEGKPGSKREMENQGKKGTEANICLLPTHAQKDTHTYKSPLHTQAYTRMI